MNSILRSSALAGLFLVMASLAPSVNAQYGYYYSGYPAYRSTSYQYTTPGVTHSTYYGTSYSAPSYYYSVPISITPQISPPVYYSYGLPQYNRTARVVLPPVMPVYRRSVVYPPVRVPVPGFGYRTRF